MMKDSIRVRVFVTDDIHDYVKYKERPQDIVKIVYSDKLDYGLPPFIECVNDIADEVGYVILCYDCTRNKYKYACRESPYIRACMAIMIKTKIIIKVEHGEYIPVSAKVLGEYHTDVVEWVDLEYVAGHALAKIMFHSHRIKRKCEG